MYGNHQGPSGPTMTMDRVVAYPISKKGEGPATMVCLDTAHDPRNALHEVDYGTATVTSGEDTPDSNKAYATLDHRHYTFDRFDK